MFHGKCLGASIASANSFDTTLTDGLEVKDRWGKRHNEVFNYFSRLSSKNIVPVAKWTIVKTFGFWLSMRCSITSPLHTTVINIRTSVWAYSIALKSVSLSTLPPSRPSQTRLHTPYSIQISLLDLNCLFHLGPDARHGGCSHAIAQFI